MVAGSLCSMYYCKLFIGSGSTTLRPQDYNLLVITTWNLCVKFSPLTAMLICPVIMIFYINFFGNYNLKMKKIMIFYIHFFGNYNLKIGKIGMYIIPNLHTFIQRILRNHYIKYWGEQTPQNHNTAISYIPQLSNWLQPWWPIVYIKGIPMISLSGKPLVQVITTWKWAKSTYTKPLYLHREVSVELLYKFGGEVVPQEP